MASDHSGVHGDVQDYYGKRVKTTEDLMTGCCTTDPEMFSKDAREARKLIHPEVLSKYITFPRNIKGLAKIRLDGCSFFQ